MTGFARETLDFLSDLRAENAKPWFESNRARYETAYVEAAKSFVGAVAPGLAELVPHIRAEPKVLGSIFRINRDTRFSADKRPYKDHLDLWFWVGERKSALAGLFFRVSPDHVIIGAGAHSFTRDQLARYRESVDADLLALVEGLERDGYRIGGETLARVPRGHDANAATSRLLKHSSLHAFVEQPAAAATQDDLSDRALAHWRRLLPLHRWLTSTLA